MKPIADNEYKLERFQAKGGWTYAVISEVAPSNSNPFGWVKVRGNIDGYEFKNYHLMPMGNGSLFLPVKAEIRKKIHKKEGDWVKITLYLDNAPLEIPAELLSCLEDDPAALKKFRALKEGEQKLFINWIYSAKREETRIERIAATIDKVSKGLKFASKPSA